MDINSLNYNTDWVALVPYDERIHRRLTNAVRDGVRTLFFPLVGNGSTVSPYMSYGIFEAISNTDVYTKRITPKGVMLLEYWNDKYVLPEDQWVTEIVEDSCTSREVNTVEQATTFIAICICDKQDGYAYVSDYDTDVLTELYDQDLIGIDADRVYVTHSGWSFLWLDMQVKL